VIITATEIERRNKERDDKISAALEKLRADAKKDGPIAVIACEFSIYNWFSRAQYAFSNMDMDGNPIKKESHQ